MIHTLSTFQIGNALKAGATEIVPAALFMRDCEILFTVRIMPGK
jgi:hypothetical protein